ncbi:MAG: methionyl-tRNA formyltransferase [Eggerthellales bacterium]|nr:methionyl-tRNA formyltransferase [Eggerthellales bacterium]
MRIVFMGTPQFAADILVALAQDHESAAVYTRADAVRGRGRALVATPVKQTAISLGIPVYTPKNFKDDQDYEQLAQLAPEAIVVAAYGVILPQRVLDIPVYGCLNAHASLLPAKRGAAPVERGILERDPYLGVCVMRMEAGLDTGPFAYPKTIVNQALSAQEAFVTLAQLAAEGLNEALADLPEGVAWTAQDDSLATYAEKLTPEDLNLDPACLALDNQARVLASGEGHPAKCQIGDKRCTVLEAEAANWPLEAPEDCSGRVAWVGKRLYLGCSSGALEVKRVKPDGKREMDAEAFACGVKDIKKQTITWGK